MKESFMVPVQKLVLAILPVMLIIGCGSQEVKEEEPTDQGASTTIGGSAASTAGVSEATPLTDEKSTTDASSTSQQVDSAASDSTDAMDQKTKDLLSERKIYFDYDQSEIKGEFREILRAHAQYLASNPNVSVVVEGHCDERGTREYNIALGEKRAFAVEQFLSLQGVSKNQIRTVSFGEERPDVEGHEDNAWKWNRRAVFVYAE